MEALKCPALVAGLKLFFSGVVAPTKNQLRSADFTASLLLYSISPNRFLAKAIHKTWAESEEGAPGIQGSGI